MSYLCSNSLNDFPSQSQLKNPHHDLENPTRWSSAISLTWYPIIVCSTHYTQDYTDHLAIPSPSQESYLLFFEFFSLALYQVNALPSRFCSDVTLLERHPQTLPDKTSLLPPAAPSPFLVLPSSPSTNTCLVINSLYSLTKWLSLRQQELYLICSLLSSLMPRTVDAQ